LHAVQHAQVMPQPTQSDRPRYWFPAKRYGWGWGVPCRWQGWAVLVGYIALTVAAVRFVPPDRNWPGFLASVFGLAAAMVFVCWWKGEPPKWRWGGD
jgi:hypothetical protein